ncbi:MAG TPA: DUF1499 domain-containing protein [Gemmatimonadota bacterium]|jgi:uncharacterized protein (DUF1499 family)
MAEARPGSRRASTLSIAALVVANISALLLLAAPLGAGFHLWDFGRGFDLMRWAVYASGLALVLALGGIVWGLARSNRSSVMLSAAALALAVVIGGIPLFQYRTARIVPPINDITTDMESPPDFVAAGRGAENGAAGAPYPGQEFADAQSAAYPDVRTLDLPQSPDEVFRAALEVARGMPGWEVVLADSSAGRIEGTATTRWFRFKDDVVVRIQPGASGTRVDIRSRSRVGQSDVGANAARIRAFTARLKERLGPA